ncbi:uncharacterized protein VDAG_05217 [Verticillium dahliae VdLs.17]|uniref:Uncharacterized protein n=1 Tax=Verticillium dahliae (strain VdLs.17 / ATCC MYA-4575 / FGSC 10137) TaxID=498257 RepID=G2X4Y5_VERDV|nr:uncharacterized protein VDAG_05217 [Verticillium dahliae VdLs.17]EGY23779.1 hypothetical protein VDAG_05217 [Verticillium dahliae VdLs.17]
MQVSLDRIEFYEPDLKAPNRPRLSTLAIPRNEVLYAPNKRAEQPRLCGEEPAWESAIVISDNDGSDGESNSDGDARSSTSGPGPEKQASLPDGCVSPRTVSKFPVGPIFDRVDHHLVDANLQPPAKPRADAASSCDRGFPLMQCTLQAPSTSPQQTFLLAPGASAFKDDTNMQRTQSPSMPISGTAYNTLHLLSRHAVYHILPATRLGAAQSSQMSKLRNGGFCLRPRTHRFWTRSSMGPLTREVSVLRQQSTQMKARQL